VVATSFEKALVGTFTAEDEHFAEWKTTEPVPEADICVSLVVQSRFRGASSPCRVP